MSPLEDLVLAENSLAHFETRLTPINDPSMRVDWFHNGKQLSAGSRIKTINDFGFVILEVANVMETEFIELVEDVCQIVQRWPIHQTIITQ